VLFSVFCFYISQKMQKPVALWVLGRVGQELNDEVCFRALANPDCPMTWKQLNRSHTLNFESGSFSQGSSKQSDPLSQGSEPQLPGSPMKAAGWRTHSTGYRVEARMFKRLGILSIPPTCNFLSLLWAYWDVTPIINWGACA
jgi:hypothetical protein